MGKRSVIPYGPQHPVLPEPVHIDLVVEDERVIEAIPSIGFIHRGLESLVEKRDFNQMTYVAERTCGICSFQHGMGYCEAVEHIMGVEVPDRAKFLRTLWAETSRMHSHLLWLGLLADGFGFENLFYQCWRVREKVLDIQEMTAGGRLIFSVNKIGGVLKDIPQDQLNFILKTMDEVEAELAVIKDTFFEDYSVKARLKGVGVLTAEQINALGAVGPFARASGVNVDMRKLGYAAYPHIDFEPITSTDGDCYARCYVRMMEVFQSIDIIRQVIAKMPAETDLAVAVKGNPNGEYFMRVEQPRGEAFYYVKGNGTPNLERMRIRTPTFANVPGLCEMLKNTELADIGLLILTIDPCISCTER
ncbi:MAG: nickel-dependent hydrogenase large subunit [Lachnospiraceae bacterium]|nr:nickel-dependent hydrogenase large subunit [Lachnospiraceae bacterium]